MRASCTGSNTFGLFELRNRMRDSERRDDGKETDR